MNDEQLRKLKRAAEAAPEDRAALAAYAAALERAVTAKLDETAEPADAAAMRKAWTEYENARDDPRHGSGWAEENEEADARVGAAYDALADIMRAPPVKPGLVVLSFREEYRIVHHGDWQASYSNGSDLSARFSPDEADAVAFIVSRLTEDPWASYLHVMFTSWAGLANFAASGRLPNAERAGEQYKSGWNVPAVHVPCADVDYEKEGWEARDADEAAASALCDRIRSAVSAELAKTKPVRTGKNTLA